MSRPVATWPALSLGWLALVALVLGLGGWAFAARLAGAVIAPGEVSISDNRQVVQHPEGGVISALMVHEGERVQAGQVLARLDDNQPASEKAIVDLQYWEMMAQRSRLQAERDSQSAIAFPPSLTAEARQSESAAQMIDRQRALFEVRRLTLAQQLHQLDVQQTQIGAQILGLVAQQAAAARQRALVDQELSAQRQLRDKGLSPATRVLALERESARLEGGEGALAAARAEAEARRSELAITAARLVSERREKAISELRASSDKLAELAERRWQLALVLSERDIRAPVSGVVYGLTLTTPRAVLRPAEPLLSIVPEGRPLVITAEIPPRHIDEVRDGESVRLRLPTLGGRDTPELSGHLSKVSPDAFQDPQTRQRYYRAEITLDAGEERRLGQKLVPGMPVEAFIATGSQSPAAYLIKPFADYFAHAFRES